MLGIVLSALVGGLSACAPRADTVRAGWRVTLVDSLAFANEMRSGTLWRVRVAHSGIVDTLPGVLAHELPVAIGDSAIYGVRFEDDRAVGLYRYHAPSRRTTLLPAPSDWVAFAAPAIAPDGRHVAFLGQDAQGRGFGAVFTVPAMRPLFRGPPVTLLETDAGGEQIQWLDDTHFEIRLALTYNTGGEQRIRGSVSPLRVAIDTVRPDSGSAPQ